MKKIFSTALFFSLLFFASVTVSFAQNKAGINIGDHWNDLEQAAGIVGNGGWIVIMACPGDGDKIAEAINKYPNINFIIRGHYPGNTPNAALAKAWAATLGAIPSSNKIYFMPWNEPNQVGSADYAQPAVLTQYINDLSTALSAIRNKKVLLLSPMMNISNPSYDGYITQLGSNFFSQFDGIAMSLYDSSDGSSTDPHINPFLANQLSIASGKPLFGVESGTSGQNFYFNSPPDSSSPLFRFVQKAIPSLPARMFAIPSYDLGGERGHTWTLFNPADVVNLLRNSPKGGTTPSSLNVVSSSMQKCPGKNYSFFETSETECTSCGGGFSLLYCLPVKGSALGEEYSKNTLKMSETVRNTYENTCKIAQFTAKASISDMSIPFAYELNQYFLGPYMDNLGARVAKQNLDPMTDFGVFEKLAPKEYQDQLRLKFLDEIAGRGNSSKYANFRINGLGPSQIAGIFRGSPDENFLITVWPQVPLFANEETEGEVIFEGPGISGSIKTSVPEVYRLNKVSTEIAKMMGTYTGEIQGIKTENGLVLAVCATEENFQKISNKETMAGTGSLVCTKDEIQNTAETLEGERHFDQSVFQTGDGGNCTGKRLNDCCGNGRKCGPPDGNSPIEICQGNLSCTCNACNQSWMTCSGPNGSLSSQGCLIKEPEHQFDIDISVKNRVPFLKQIAENTVGKNGFLRTFLPLPKSADTSQEQYFKDVAGESEAIINLANINTEGGMEIKAESSNLISLLFYKLGTVMNVKKFVSGVVLWPWREISQEAPSEKPVVGSLTELFNQVGSQIGVPPKILEAIMRIEGPETFDLTDEEVETYSQSGATLPDCGPNVCSATGPMQMTIGRDNLGSSTCSNCCGYHTCLTQCPNAWAEYGSSGNPCNLYDSVAAAARKLKSDSGAASSDNWTEAQVRDAAYHYYGCCDPEICYYERLGGTYCDFVWNYYNQ